MPSLADLEAGLLGEVGQLDPSLVPDGSQARGLLDPGTSQADPIWPTSNPVGTERFVDYRGWDRPVAPTLPPDALSDALTPAPNTEYGSVLPIARDTKTGDLRVALPQGLRDLLQGGYDLSQGPRTGDVTPAGTMALAALAAPELLERPQEGVLSAFGRRPPEAFEATPGLRPPIDLAPGDLSRVPTRIPTAKPRGGEPLPDPYTNMDLKIGIDAARDSGDAYGKNAITLRGADYPDLPVKGLRNPDSITDAAVAHMRDNLLHLHDQFLDTFGPATTARAGNWYDGANVIAHGLADRYGYRPENVAGALANLSPQKDWYQNGELGQRLIDIIRTKQGQGLTPEMNSWASNHVANLATDTPTKRAAADQLQMSLASLRRGQTLGEINDPDTRALFVRAYDEAHNPREYPVITPEGGFGDLMTNDDGVTPRKIGWGSFTEIKKALAALEAADLATISRNLGDNHKVRSFYNNIIAPNSLHGDTTIDTHAIAAAHLRPLGGSDPVVSVGLGAGGSSSNATGSKGAYGIYHEAYRQAAEQRGLLPRQMQSIAWEAVRGLFSPAQKRDASFYQENGDIWQAFRNGRMSADEARRAVLDHAGGINPPSWWTPPPGAPTQ